MYSSLAVLLHIGVPLILSSHHHCPILTEYQSPGLICLSSLTRKGYQGDDYIPSRKNSEVSAVGTYTPAQCQVHASRPARVLIMLYMPLEKVLQNKAVGMNFSVDSQYQFQATSKVR